LPCRFYLDTRMYEFFANSLNFFRKLLFFLKKEKYGIQST
jgi:hypothetical protein